MRSIMMRRRGGDDGMVRVMVIGGRRVREGGRKRSIEWVMK